MEAPAMETTRSANATWEGDLLTGAGSVSGGTGLFSDLPTSWSSRTEAPQGRTSPEELLAAAHASCYSMAFSNGLAKAGFPAEHVDVRADVTFTKGDSGWSVTRSALTVRARVPGIDEATFQQTAEGARTGCPISRALNPSIEVTVDAKLEH
jgi:lipoyl-dependent peroxiredoxin